MEGSGIGENVISKLEEPVPFASVANPTSIVYSPGARVPVAEKDPIGGSTAST